MPIHHRAGALMLETQSSEVKDPVQPVVHR
jgi:hypothetical protein